jgi:hypothetical protein
MSNTSFGLAYSELFIDEWTHISQRRMAPLPIIGDFEILKKRLPGLLMGRVDFASYTLLFE